jgi:hypothetical protein
VLVTKNITYSNTGTLDLNNNAAIVDYTGASPIIEVQARIRIARNSGAWNFPGISSTVAKNNPLHNTTLGTMEATDFTNLYGPNATFAGETFDTTAVLIKYTYYGDGDFNGKVDLDDFVRTSTGYHNHLSGWLNGDYDGNGVVNFDDFSLIDLAFNTQLPQMRPAGPGKAPKRSLDI